MSQDLRLYSLSLLIVLMLWTAPVRASYITDTGCPTLAVPIQLNDGDIWHSGSEEDGDWMDLRNLYPLSGNAQFTSNQGDYGNDLQDCSLSVGSGSYYDGGNHLWVLDDNLTCDFVGNDNGGDFRAGEVEY